MQAKDRQGVLPIGIRRQGDLLGRALETPVHVLQTQSFGCRARAACARDVHIDALVVEPVHDAAPAVPGERGVGEALVGVEFQFAMRIRTANRVFFSPVRRETIQPRPWSGSASNARQSSQ